VRTIDKGYERAIGDNDFAGGRVRGLGGLEFTVLLAHDRLGTGEGIKVAAGICMPRDTEPIGVQKGCAYLSGQRLYKCN
jgi:hypothetical protein